MDERDYDLYSLIYMIWVDSTLTILIVLGYWIYNCRSKNEKSSRISQAGSSTKIINPFVNLDQSNHSNDLSPLNQPLMDEYRESDDNEYLFERTESLSKISSIAPIDMKKFFSINTNAFSKIELHQTPSTFMRRSFNLDNLYPKEGVQKKLSFCGWIKEIYKLDIDSI